jgi:hypothetical protein
MLGGASFVMDANTELKQFLEKTYSQVLAQREEILQAFIAKYGGQPDDFVQVLTHDFANGQLHWRVYKKEDYETKFNLSPLK